MAGRPHGAADIFVSYSSLDRSWVSSLVSRLEAMGWQVWWDRELIAGAEFDDEIAEQLASARVTLVVWSENSVKRPWVKAEADEARELGTLLPVLKDSCRPPLVFRRYHTVDLSAWDGNPEDPAFLSLLKAITTRTRGSVPDERPERATARPAGEGEARAAPGSSVEVGAGLEAEDVEVEEIVGEEFVGAAPDAKSDKVGVLNGARLKGAKLGKITGRSIRDSSNENGSSKD